jgi:hypothetical protein
MKGKNRERKRILEPINALKYSLCEALITLRRIVVKLCAPCFLCSMFGALSRYNFFKERPINTFE